MQIMSAPLFLIMNMNVQLKLHFNYSIKHREEEQMKIKLLFFGAAVGQNHHFSSPESTETGVMSWAYRWIRRPNYHQQN